MKPRQSRGFLIRHFLSDTQVVLVLSYLNPNAFFNSSLVSSKVTPFVVFLRGFDRAKRHDHVLLADTEEAAYFEHEASDLAGLVDQDVIDITNFAFLRIVYGLLVVVCDGPALARRRGRTGSAEIAPLR